VATGNAGGGGACAVCGFGEQLNNDMAIIAIKITFMIIIFEFVVVSAALMLFKYIVESVVFINNILYCVDIKDLY
jgi:hypothetical protein